MFGVGCLALPERSLIAFGIRQHGFWSFTIHPARIFNYPPDFLSGWRSGRHSPFTIHHSQFTIHKPHLKQRIISLVPSQTELLYYLGLQDEVVGITKFCVHPKKWHKNKTRIGGTKNINIEKIRLLLPTLIIANKEENVKEQVEALANIALVYTSDIADISDALAMIKLVGFLTEKRKKSANLIRNIQATFAKLEVQRQIIHQPENLTKVAYLIWQNPFMVAGGDTFINDILLRCGFQNHFANFNRYPEVTVEELKDCDIIFLSSEPFPFKQKHLDDLEKQLPNSKIILVDGEMFSWYGSRLLKSGPYLLQLIKQLQL